MLIQELSQNTENPHVWIHGMNHHALINFSAKYLSIIIKWSSLYLFFCLDELKKSSDWLLCCKINMQFFKSCQFLSKENLLAIQDNFNYIWNSYSHDQHQGTPDLSLTCIPFSPPSKNSGPTHYLWIQCLVAQKLPQLQLCWTNPRTVFSLTQYLFSIPSFLLKFILFKIASFKSWSERQNESILPPGSGEKRRKLMPFKCCCLELI